MTNRNMVKPGADPKADGTEAPNRTPLPPMPADGDSPTPTTEAEPIDSPQPNAKAERAPAEGEIGLVTKR